MCPHVPRCPFPVQWIVFWRWRRRGIKWKGMQEEARGNGNADKRRDKAKTERERHYKREQTEAEKTMEAKMGDN